MGRNRSVGAASLLLLTLILFSSFTLGTTRNTSQGTMQSRNQVTTQSLEDFYWKPSFTDYALSGMPDFDQRQWGTYNWTYFGSWSHCGPVAVANSLWWLDSEFEPNPVAPPTVNDGFSLVKAYGQWDDHDPQNVAPLVEHLAFLMDTNGMRTQQVHSGTNVYDMEAGLTQYLSWTGVNPLGDVNGDGVVDQTDANIVAAAMGSTPGQAAWNLFADIFPASTTYPPAADNVIDQNDMNLVTAHMGQTGLFYEHTVSQPDFSFIENEVERCQDVVLLIGYWVYNAQTGWYRESGHFVTVAGVDSQNLKLAVSDPTLDAFENGMIPEGHVPIPHVHLPPEPPYTTHNNASLVSQDIYTAMQITPPFPPCPGGNWALANYGDWLPTPPFFAVIESAVITSPSGTRDVAVTNVTTCKDGANKPFPIVGRYCQMHINATVENQGNYTETFAVTIYASNATANIAINQTQLVLPSAASVVIPFHWNATFPYGNYTVSAVADTVPGETDTADNTYVGRTVLVTIPGDLDGNYRVIGNDLNTLLVAYGSPGNPARPYNPNCDLAMDDHKVDGKDLNMLLSHYGWHYP